MFIVNVTGKVAVTLAMMVVIAMIAMLAVIAVIHSCKHPSKSFSFLFSAQCGSAMIEFCVAMLPIIMLGSLILEVTYWHTARQRLALATSQAVDLATMQHGAISVAWDFLRLERPELIIQAHDVQFTTDTSNIFADFSDPILTKRYGQPTIRHDFLNSQHEQYLSVGWRGGRGPASGETILGANTLSLTVTAWHKPYLSWLGEVMQRLQGHNRLPIRVTQSAIMQSHRFKPAAPFVPTAAIRSANSKYLLDFSNVTHLSRDAEASSNRTQHPIPAFLPKRSIASMAESQACAVGICCAPE